MGCKEIKHDKVISLERYCSQENSKIENEYNIKDERYIVSSDDYFDSSNIGLYENNNIQEDFERLIYKTMGKRLIKQENNMSDRKKSYMKEDDTMDDILKTYINKVDRDQSELREDVRESERRLYDINKSFKEDINNKIDFSIMNNDKNTNELLTNIKEFQKEVNQDLKSMDNSIMEFRKFQVATILSIVGIVISLIIGLAQLV